LLPGDYRTFFFSSRRRHTRSKRDWSSDVCSSDLQSYDAEYIRDFAQKLAQSLEGELPDLVVSNMNKQVRGNKVLVDWSQNNWHRSEERRVGKERRGGRMGGKEYKYIEEDRTRRCR